MDSRNSRIKVMFVAECAGGVQRFLRSFLRYADRSRFEYILVLSQLYQGKDFESLADCVEYIPIYHDISLKALTSAKQVRTLIRKYAPHVIYAHSSIAGAVTRIANLGLKNKCLYNPHGWSFNMQRRNPWIFGVLEKIMAPFCDRIICISEAEKQSALKMGICRENKLTVIYNGIDFAEYGCTSASRASMGIPEDGIVVGMVGRICRQKAADVFVKVAARVKEKIKNAYFVIVGDVLDGDAQERADIETLAKELGVRLIITGWVEDPLAYVKQFDVACLFSRWEGFGYAIPEYMLCGKPIVATNVDAIGYLIQDGENGLLIDMDDDSAGAEKILALCTDTALRDRIVRNAMADVKQRFDVRRVVREHEEIFAACAPAGKTP